MGGESLSANLKYVFVLYTVLHMIILNLKNVNNIVSERSLHDKTSTVPVYTNTVCVCIYISLRSQPQTIEQQILPQISLD